MAVPVDGLMETPAVSPVPGNTVIKTVSCRKHPAELEVTVYCVVFSGVAIGLGIEELLNPDAGDQE